MPELPEVETIASDLREKISKQKLEKIEISDPSVINLKNNRTSVLVQKYIKEINRHGKYLSLVLDDNQIVTIHLRMTGRLIIAPKNAPLEKYERARLIFENNSLIFADIRRFGKIWLCDEQNHKQETGVCRLGSDALDPKFSFNDFKKALKNKNGVIKKYLLSQNIVAGIGNIYADEILFLSKVCPDRKVSTLTESELKNIYHNIAPILKKAIKNRGTSFSDYVDTKAEKGKNQEELFVYGRGGQKCLQCGNKLQKIRIEGRGTVFCENCQK